VPTSRAPADARPPGGPGLALPTPRQRPAALAALTTAVLLAHALLLGAWPGTPASDGSAALQVRQIVLADAASSATTAATTAAVAAATTAVTKAAASTDPAVTPLASPPAPAPALPSTGAPPAPPRPGPPPDPSAPAGDRAEAALKEPPATAEPPSTPDASAGAAPTAADLAADGLAGRTADTAADAAADRVAITAALAAPTYDTDLPPAALLRYTVQRGAREGEATLRWQRDGARYELEMSGRIAGLERFGWASRGGFDASGLAPERFVVRRRGRDAAAVNFGGDAAPVITFSGPGFALPRPAGVQDRVSWLVQLSAIVRALPQPVAAGTAVVIPVVGPRGDLAAWRFVAGATEPLELPAGAVPAAQPWLRASERTRDLDVRVWLDPARGQLPVRLRLEARPDGGSTEWRLQALQAG
jgi:hypothetical protein